jgi:hypothetical protein
MDMGGWPVDAKCVRSGGTMLMSDSSDSDEDRSGTSCGSCWWCCRAAASGSDEATGASRKACGWCATAAAACAPLTCVDLLFVEEEEEGHSLDGGYVRSWRAGRAQAFGSTTIGARSYMAGEWVRCVWQRLGVGGKCTRVPMTAGQRAKGKVLLFAPGGGSRSVLCLRHGRRAVVRDIRSGGDEKADLRSVSCESRSLDPLESFKERVL